MLYKSCLNLAIFGSLDWETQLSATSRAGFEAVGIRMNILQDYLGQGKTLAMAKQKLAQYNLDPFEMNFFADWIYCPKNKQSEVFAKFEEFARISQALGSRLLMLPSGYADPLKDTGLVLENFQEICDRAARYQLVAGLEFVPWSEIGTVKMAWELVKRVNRPNAGLVLDTFHYFEGGSSLADLEAVPVEKIVMVHLNDLEPADVDLLTLTRNYRVLPGEGVYQLQPILKYLFDHNYQGYYNLEILNPKYPKMDPGVVARQAKTALDELLKNSSLER